MKADIGVIEFMRCYFEPEKLNLKHLLWIVYQLLTIKRTLRSRPPFPELVVLWEAAQLSVWSKDCIGKNHLRVGQGQSQGQGPLHYRFCRDLREKNPQTKSQRKKLKIAATTRLLMYLVHLPLPPSLGSVELLEMGNHVFHSLRPSTLGGDGKTIKRI